MFHDNDTPDFNQNKKKENRGKKKVAPQRTPVQSQIETQLASLFTRARTGEGHLRDIRELGQEGVDHINVNRFSKSTLGYLLSTTAKLDFWVLGHQYSSIGNLMAYYKSHCTNEEVTMAGTDTMQAFTSEEYDRYPQFNNLYAVVCLGYWAIIQNNPALLDALNINDIPFDSYVERKGVRTRHQASKILVRAIQEAHLAVKFGRDPQLNAFILDDTLRSLMSRSARESVYLEDLIADMFRPETVRDSYLAAYGEISSFDHETDPVAPKSNYASKPLPVIEDGSDLNGSDRKFWAEVLSSDDRELCAASEINGIHNQLKETLEILKIQPVVNISLNQAVLDHTSDHDGKLVAITSHETVQKIHIEPFAPAADEEDDGHPSMDLASDESTTG